MSRASLTPPVFFSRCVSRRTFMRPSLSRASRRLASASSSGSAASMIIACMPSRPNARASMAYRFIWAVVAAISSSSWSR